LKIKVLHSAVGAESERCFSLSILVNDAVAIDAGSIGYLPSIADQRRIRTIFLSHSHLDHVASLPIFLDNVYEHGPNCPTIYAGAEVIEALKSDFFNERVWPDFVRLSGEESPFLRLVELKAEIPVDVGGVSITPVALQHAVPTFWFLIQDAGATVALVCDTLPTERIWQLLGEVPNLAAVFIEVSFPNSMQWLADKAKHLTPATVNGELAKIPKDVPAYAVHIKPVFHEKIVGELAALGRPDLHVAEPGRTYEF
jgi:cAMP phosphodiesterase